MSSIKKLAGQTAVYGLSSILGRALNFLLTPLFTGTIPTGDYGVLSYFYSIIAFFTVFYQMGMVTTYFRYSHKIGEVKAYNQIFTFIIVFTSVFSLLFLFSSDTVVNNLGQASYSEYFMLLIIVVWIDAITAIPFARLRNEGKAKKFAIIKLLNIFLTIGLNLLFLVVFKKSYEEKMFLGLADWVQTWFDPNYLVGYVFISNLIANAVFIPLLIKELLRYRPSFSMPLFKELIPYAFPLFLVDFSGIINEVMDRILLKKYLGSSFRGFSIDENIGIYSGVYKFSLFMSLAVQSFKFAADPFFFSKAEDKNAPELFAKVMKWFVITCAVIIVFVGLGADYIWPYILLNSDYKSGLDIVPVLLLAYAFYGIYFNLSFWYKLTDRTYFGTIISVTGAIITLVVNIVFIPQYGYMASAYATLFCFAVMVILSYALGRKYFPVPYQVGNALFYLTLAMIFVFGIKFIPIENWWLGLILSLGACITFVIVVYLKDGKQLKGVLKKEKS